MTEMLRLVITADADQAVKKIKQLGGVTDSAAKSTDDLGKSSKQTGVLMKAGLVAGATAAAYAMVRFGASSVKAAAEAEQAQMRLDDAFAKFPKLADSSADALRALNSEMQKKTRFDDDALASGQAILAQFDLTGKQLEDVTPLVADYAAKMGMDIPDAATNVGKALLGNTRALKSLGIDYKLTGDRATDFANITELMSAKVGGFAEKDGKTAAGQLAILNNQFGELQETVGNALIPALSGLVTGTTAVVGAFGSLPGPVQTTALAIAGVTVAAGVVVPWIARVKTSLETLGWTAGATGGKMGKLASSLKVAAGAAAAFMATDILMGAVEIGRLGEVLRDSSTDVDTFSAALESMQSSVKTLEGIDGQDIWQNLVPGVREANALENLPVIFADIRSRLSGNGGLQAEAEAAGEKLKGMGAAASDSADGLGEGVEATYDFASAQGELNGELDGTIEKFTLLNGGVIDLTKANMDFAAGQDEIADAFKASGGALGDLTREQRDAKSALIDQAEGIEGVRAAMEAQKVPAEQIATRIADLRQKMIDQAVAAGGNREAVTQLTDSILKIPTSAATVVSVETLEAQRKIDALRAKWDAFRAAFSGAPAARLPSGANVGGKPEVRATGGPVAAGTPYLVGERGPELFVPSTSGGIVPNGALSSTRISAAGATMSVTVNVGGSVVSERDLVRAVRDGLVDMQRRGDTVAA